MMMPPVQYGVAETPDRKNVVLVYQTIYGQFICPLDPNHALQYARDIRAKAKELNTGLVVVRQRAAGAVLLDKPDDEEDDAGG